jgi:transglutaminase-like putative cysteine protease
MGAEVGKAAFGREEERSGGRVEGDSFVPGMQKYLKSTEIIDCDAESVREEARALTAGLRTRREKAVALFYFVRDKMGLLPKYSGKYQEGAMQDTGDLFRCNGKRAGDNSPVGDCLTLGHRICSG